MKSVSPIVSTDDIDTNDANKNEEDEQIEVKTEEEIPKLEDVDSDEEALADATPLSNQKNKQRKTRSKAPRMSLR